MMEMTIGELLLLIGLPSAFTAGLIGFLFWWLERKIKKRDEIAAKREAERDAEDRRREEARKKNELLVIKSSNAAIALGEATARAVQRIPDAHCNGDMHAALNYATNIKHKHKDFIVEQGIEALY